MQLKIPVSSDDHRRGPDDAPVTLVEYGDYQCPDCGAAYPVVKQLQQRFGAGLRFIFRNFPLTQKHPLAKPAAHAAEFAGARGRFWPMHDAIYENQPRLSLETLLELACMEGIEPEALRHVLDAGSYEVRVREDFLGGVRSGVSGTPTFFVNGYRQNTREIEGLSDAIRRALMAGNQPVI